MRVGILGGLVVRDDSGAELPVGGLMPRTLLAVLAVADGRPVTADALIDALWDGDAPSSATGSLHSTVSRLRRVLDVGRDSTVLRLDAAGYCLDVDPDSVDAHRFVALARRGRALLDGDPAASLRLLEEAEALWRGPALAEFADRDFARVAASRLEGLRVDALEDSVDAQLALGASTEVLGRLAELTASHPMRERLRGQQAIALYRSGRQSDALAVVRDTRLLLRDELGIDLSPALQDIEARLLRHDAALVPVRPTTGPAGGGEVASVEGTHSAEGSGSSTARSADAVPADRLAGRDGELALMRALLRETSAGEVRFALLEGQPGIGKTRLLEEVAALAAASGIRAVWGRCADSAVAPAYWPWLEALRALEADGVLKDAPPELAALLDPGAAVDEAPADAVRFRLFEVVTAALVRAASRTPLVVLLEDVHWADPASAELLNHLAVRLRDVPVAVVASLRELEIGRDDAVTAALAAVIRRPGARRFLLRPVPASATGDLIRYAVGEEVEVEVAAAIHRRAEGNPFFIGELSRLLSDTGQLDDPAAVEGAEVPLGVRDVVRRRLGTLPAGTRSVVEVAAVLGAEVDLSMLATATGTTVEDCIADSEPALASRLLRDVDQSPGRLRFAHALVRDAALAEVSPLRRAQLHAQVAQALTATHGEDDDVAEIIASHLWQAAGVVGHARVARALERASDVALRRTAYETAGDLLERAVSLWRSAGGAEAQEAELLATVRLVSLRRGSRGYQHAYESVALDRAEELALRSGRTDLYLGLLLAQWGATGTSGDIPATQRLGERIRSIAADSEDPVIRILGTVGWAVTCWHLGRMTEADACAGAVDEEVARLSEEDMVRLTDVDGAALLLGFAVHIRIIAGSLEPEGAFEALAATFERPYDQLVMGNFGSFTGVMRGDPTMAAHWARWGLDHDRDDQFPFFGSACRVNLGWATARQGDPETGLAMLEAGRTGFAATGARTSLGVMAASRADAMLLAGQAPAEVEAYLDEVDTVVEEMGERFVLPYLMLARAAVALARDEDAAAARILADAIALGDEMGIAAVRLRAAVVDLRRRSRTSPGSPTSYAAEPAG